jgi:hypothetical protein
VDDSQDRESLRDLDAVKVFVEELGPEARVQRLSRDDIQRTVETRLREAGIRVLTSGDFPPGDPFLRIAVGVTVERQRMVAYHLVVDFVQYAFLRRNPQFVHNRAQTWKASERLGLIPAAQLATSVQRDLIRQVDEYVAAYRAVNPRG